MNIIDDFFGWLEGERNYSAHTINSYKRDIADFLSWQDITPEVFMPDKLTRNAVMDWAIWRFDNGLKATTINRGMAALRTLARWMQKSGIAEGNALKLLRQFKPPKRLPTFVPDTRMDNVVRVAAWRPLRGSSCACATQL
jgi:integrase/recombinase XerC